MDPSASNRYRLVNSGDQYTVYDGGVQGRCVSAELLSHFDAVLLCEALNRQAELERASVLVGPLSPDDFP